MVKMYWNDLKYHCPCGATYDNYVTYCRDKCGEENNSLAK